MNIASRAALAAVMVLTLIGCSGNTQVPLPTTLPTGAALNTNRLTIAKIVAFAAIPSPIDTITASTNTGAFTSRRNVGLISASHAVIAPSPAAIPPS